jgi:hypothetical protein
MLSRSFMRTPDDSGGKFTLGFAAGSHNLVVDSDYSELQIKSKRGNICALGSIFDFII